MEAYGGPAQPSPTAGQCLNGELGSGFRLTKVESKNAYEPHWKSSKVKVLRQPRLSNGPIIWVSSAMADDSDDDKITLAHQIFGKGAAVLGRVGRSGAATRYLAA
jgi:hypothetical protein